MMLEATRLTRTSRLTEATALLQRMLRGETVPDESSGSAGEVILAGGYPPIIDATTETISKTASPLLGTAMTVKPGRFGVLRTLLDRVSRSGLGFQGLRQPGSVSTPDIVPTGGKFIAATYSNQAGTRIEMIETTPPPRPLLRQLTWWTLTFPIVMIVVKETMGKYRSVRGTR